MSAGEDMSAGTPLLRGAIAPAGRRVAPNRAPSLCRAGGFGLDSLNGRQHRQPTLDRDFDPKLRGQVAENDRDDFVRRAVCGLCIRNPERKRTRLARFARLGAHCLARASAMANVSARGAASAFLPRQMRGGGVRSTRSAARSRAPRASPGANVRACHLCVGRGAASLLPRRKRACLDRPAPFASSSRDDDARTEGLDGKDDAAFDGAAEPLATRVALALIRFYRTQISPLTPPSCRFVPTCSQYAMTAFRRFGPAKGLALTAWRILRCNPWGGGGVRPAEMAARRRRRRRRGPRRGRRRVTPRTS